MSGARNAPIRLRVVTPTHRARMEIPWTDMPVAALGNLPADMLDGATLYVQGATSLHKDDRLVVPHVPPAPAKAKR
jgi:hypothetical protein